MSFDRTSDPAVLGSHVTLTMMEIVLGIDSIAFISVLVVRLPATAAKRARQIGHALALVFRIATGPGATNPERPDQRAARFRLAGVLP